MKIRMTVFLFAMCLSAFAQEILFPKASTVLYTGDQIPIAWKTRGFGDSVWIHVFDPAWRSGTTIYVARMEPDDGEFNWTVSKGRLEQTNLILTVFYGVGGANMASEIPITILPGPRPAGIPLPTILPVQVPVSIKKVISVEWVANTNHTYQVLSSKSLSSTNWTVVAEGQPPETNAIALFYADVDNMFFKVEDTTPLKP